MIVNFEIEYSTELKFEGRLIDLHNNFDLIGYEYKSTDRQLILKLAKAMGDWVDKSEFTNLTLTHINVFFLNINYDNKEFVFNGKKFLIGHGDGLGPGDHGYKMMKKVFRNPVCKWLFGVLPPYIGIGLANYFSRKSRAKTGHIDEVYLGDDKEWLIVYSKEVLTKQHYDYFIFGHRHLPIVHPLAENSVYINLGEWIKYNSYAAFDGNEVQLIYYKD